MQEMIGERIRALRVKLGLSQEELGSLLNCASNTVCRWERNAVRVATGYRSLPDAFQVSLLLAFERAANAGVKLRDEVPGPGRRYGRIHFDPVEAMTTILVGAREAKAA